MNEVMIAAIICREYGWTYQEYESQPAWFIDTVITMLKAEGIYYKNKLK